MKRLNVALMIAGLAFAAQTSARAQGPYPGPTTVPPGGVDQQSPDVSFDATRNQYLLVWSEDRGAGSRIYAKRLQSTGHPLGGAAGGAYELTAATEPNGAKGEQRWPSVADGVVVWSERATGGADYDIYAQRLTTVGTAIGTPRKVALGPSNQVAPDLVRSAAHEWVLVWSDDANDAGDIMGVRVTDALMPLGAPAPLVTGPSAATDPAIHPSAADPGYLFLAWVDDSAGNPDIWGQSVSPTLVERPGWRGTPQAVVASPEAERAPDIGKSARFGGLFSVPIASDGLQLYYVVDTPAGAQVRGQRMRPNGLPVGPTIDIGPAGAIGDAPAAALNTRARDRYLVAWLAKGTDAGAMFDIDGTEVDVFGTIRRPTIALVHD